MKERRREKDGERESVEARGEQGERGREMERERERGRERAREGDRGTWMRAHLLILRVLHSRFFDAH